MDLLSWDWTPPGPRRLEQPVVLLRFTGPDSLRVLHGQTSQALLDARPGDWRSTCCLTPTARLRALAEVLVADDGAWLVITAGDGPALRQAFDRVLFPADRVELGPLHSARWLRVLGGEASPSRSWRPLNQEDGLDKVTGWWLGQDLLLLEGATPPPEWADIPLLADQEAEFWRLQQGEPAWPAEINEAFNPFELGLADRVSLQKGCYLGQEPLAKLASNDGVKQQLRRWEAPPLPAPATALEPGSVLQGLDGSRAGQITSRLQRTDGSWVGLAMVRRQALDCPTLVTGDGAVSVQLSRPGRFQDPPGAQPSGGRGGSGGV